MGVDDLIWSNLREAGLSEFAVAGIMGNLYAESGLIPNNLQNSYEAILGMTDVQYTAAVDNGTYTKFVWDAAGYGLAQWTFWSRKQDLQRKAKEQNVSIGDLNMQLDFLCDELREFGLWDKLNACQSVREASNIILFEFEKPLDMGTAVQNSRASWGQGYYDRFAGKAVSKPAEEPAREKKYWVMCFRKGLDRAEARELLSVAEGYGFEGVVSVSEE